MKKQLVLSKLLMLLMLCGFVATLLVTGVAILEAQHNRNLYIRETIKSSILDTDKNAKDDEITLLKQQVEELQTQLDNKPQ